MPPTWTPAPTATPSPAGPPAATATLVIRSTRTAVPAGSTSSRRYPVLSFNRIGAWSDTTDLPKASAPELALKVQLAVGPQARPMRLANPLLVSLAPLIASGSAETLLSSARSLVRGNDGLLITPGARTAGPGLPLSTLRAALPNKLLIVDSILLPSSRPPPETDGVCLCEFLRGRNSPPPHFPSETEWKRQVDALARLSASFHGTILVSTRFDASTAEGAKSVDTWFQYALGSFLLATNSGRTYFSFQGPSADEMMLDPSLEASLGSPVGTYFRLYGLYIRQFQKGLVLVNPSASDAEMPLMRTYQTRLGTELTTAQLAPNSALILLVRQ